MRGSRLQNQRLVCDRGTDARVVELRYCNYYIDTLTSLRHDSDVMAKQITVRGVLPELSRRIERLAQERGTSVNATVLEILKGAVGLDQSARRTRLQRYTTWTEQDLREFEATLAAQRVVDVKLWS